MEATTYNTNALNTVRLTPGREWLKKFMVAVEHSTPKYLTSKEAAAYLRKSVSWLIRRKDIPYTPGNPNTYALVDLDEWFERNKHHPMG